MREYKTSHGYRVLEVSNIDNQLGFEILLSQDLTIVDRLGRIIQDYTGHAPGDGNGRPGDGSDRPGDDNVPPGDSSSVAYLISIITNILL